MATVTNLPESSTWETGIQQLERTDLWDAGVGGSGIANKQAKQLANRSVFLKTQVDKINAKINFNLNFPDQTVNNAGNLNSKGTVYVHSFPMNDWDWTTPNDGITRDYIVTISCFANFTFNASGNVQMVFHTTTAGPTYVPLITANLRYPFGCICMQKQIQLGPNVRVKCYYTNNATGANATFQMGSLHIREV